MIRSTLSILGMYNYRPDIFDGFKLPEGVSIDILEPELLSQLAELELLYSDADVMKTLISSWSARRLYAWTKLYDTTKFEYNPIWNKDGVVTETETRDMTGDDLETRNLQNKGATKNVALSTEHVDVYGFNSGNKSPSEETKINSQNTENAEEANTGTVKNDRAESETIKRSRLEQGNIGVTTTQRMIKEEREIADFDIYQYIIDDFKDRFCLLVY